MPRKVKIILHHKVDQNVETERRFLLMEVFKNFWTGFLNFTFTIAYTIGVVLISIPKIPKLILQGFSHVNKIKFTKPPVYKAMGFIIMIIIAVTPIFLLQVASEGQKIGGKILGISTGVLNDVSSAKSALEQQDYSLAQNNFAGALKGLNQAQSELDQSSVILKSIVKFAPDSYSTSNALEAAEILTEVAKTGSELLEQVNRFKFSPQGLTITENGNVKQTLLDIKTSIKDIDQKLARANELIAPLDSGSLPAKYQGPLKDSQDLINDLSNKMHSLQAASGLFTDLLLGNKKFLVLLQNNNELRATGGYIGTIAQGNLYDGSIEHLVIRSVYDLDGQLLNWITPPNPLRAVNNRLYLRDSNWFASFPKSSERLSVMYEQEGGETPDLVLAITPDLFIDLLNKTGPITLPTYDVTVSSSNFIEQIQTTTSIAYDKNLNQPKQLLADLYPILLQKISNDSDGILGLLELMQKSLTTKNILIYSKDPVLQKSLSDFHWTGEIIKTDKDYLQINSSNLGGTKTDRSVKRSVKLQTTIQSNGSIINQIEYTITNPLPQSPGLKNLSFTRFFVPQGSKVLAADGFTDLTLEKLPENQKYYRDIEVEEWNNNLQFDDNKKVYIGLESDKTFFANWIEVNGGETKTVTVTYQLPFSLKKLDNYSLMWQKQPGMLPFEANQEIIYQDRNIVWDNLGNQNKEVIEPETGKSAWKLTNLTQDQFIGLVLNSGK